MMIETTLQENQTPHFEKEQLEALHGVIDSLLQCYIAHKQNLTKKRDILIKGDLPPSERMTALQAVDRTLLSLNQRARQLEQERCKLHLNMRCDNMSLNELIAALPNGFNGMARKLRTLQQNLQVALREGKNLNDEIKGLLELSLGWVRETIEIVATAVAPEGSSYGAFASKPGSKIDAPPRPGLNSTVSHSA